MLRVLERRDENWKTLQQYTLNEQETLQITALGGLRLYGFQSLLGGSGSLRGYATGHRAGDNLAAVSAEVRYPLTSPLHVGRFGVKAFGDAGTAWSAGQRLKDQRFERGFGGGLYLGAAAIIMDLDVAWPEKGKPRAHFGLGVSF